MITPRKKRPYYNSELAPIDTKGGGGNGIPPTNLFNTPISYRENANSLFWDKSPCFAVTRNDFSSINSEEYNKHLSRAHDKNNLVDVFGVKWTFVEAVGGSITLGGDPIFDDANDWKNKIVIPDIDKWDWAADAANHKADTRFAVNMTPLNGFGFERLISLMDFMNAAMALVDDDQQDALHELLEALSDLGCRIVDKVIEYWPATDGFTLHDDWGSQKDPFFSDEIARKVFLPHMKALVDHIHSKGRYCGLHSCGHVEDRVGVFIDAGIDTWQMQTMNDAYKLYQNYGDKIVVQVTTPDFDLNDDAAAVKTARDYVDTFCKPGKPTMLVTKAAFNSKAFTEELYSYSRKHYLNQ